MDDEYTCERCHKTYQKGWSDEEAMEESEDIFGEIPKEDRAVICDDCWNYIMSKTN